MPDTSAVTAYLRIAPTAISNSEVPIVIRGNLTRHPGGATQMDVSRCYPQRPLRTLFALCPRGPQRLPGASRKRPQRSSQQMRKRLFVLVLALTAFLAVAGTAIAKSAQPTMLQDDKV